MSYTVSDESGCKVLRGELPLNDALTLMQGWAERGDVSVEDEGWVADARLAMALSAVLVCGPRSATQAYREKLGIE